MKFYIREARQQAGLSQKELADKIGVAPNTLHGYETGKHDPKSDLLAVIANVCGVTVDFLLGVNKEKSLTPSSDEVRVSRAELVSALEMMRVIQPGGDLSDEDLAFLIAMLDAMKIWFSKRK